MAFLLLVVVGGLTLLNEYYELLLYYLSSWHFCGSKKSAKDEEDLVRSDLAFSCGTYEYDIYGMYLSTLNLHPSPFAEPVAVAAVS